MAMTKEEAVKALRERDSVYVAYSQATRQPYVIEDEETANDQVWMFATEEEIKAFGQKKLEDKILTFGMKYDKKDYPRLYGSLYLIGVNAIVWNDGEDSVEVEIENIAHQQDFSKVEPEKRPLFNPTMQLCAIYFMQEVRRPLPREDRMDVLRPMEEELIANLRRSEFLIAMNVDPENEKRINLPFVKNKDGKILQPFFTDVMEFERFARGKKLRAAKVPFSRLASVMIEQSEGMVMNPLGVNLVLGREQMQKILATMGIEMPKSLKAVAQPSPEQGNGGITEEQSAEAELSKDDLTK